MNKNIPKAKKEKASECNKKRSHLFLCISIQILIFYLSEFVFSFDILLNKLINHSISSHLNFS